MPHWKLRLVSASSSWTNPFSCIVRSQPSIGQAAHEAKMRFPAMGVESSVQCPDDDDQALAHFCDEIWAESGNASYSVIARRTGEPEYWMSRVEWPDSGTSPHYFVMAKVDDLRQTVYAMREARLAESPAIILPEFQLHYCSRPEYLSLRRQILGYKVPSEEFRSILLGDFFEDFPIPGVDRYLPEERPPAAADGPKAQPEEVLAMKKAAEDAERVRGIAAAEVQSMLEDQRALNEELAGQLAGERQARVAAENAAKELRASCKELQRRNDNQATTIETMRRDGGDVNERALGELAELRRQLEYKSGQFLAEFKAASRWESHARALARAFFDHPWRPLSEELKVAEIAGKAELDPLLLCGLLEDRDRKLDFNPLAAFRDEALRRDEAGGLPVEWWLPARARLLKGDVERIALALEEAKADLSLRHAVGVIASCLEKLAGLGPPGEAKEAKEAEEWTGDEAIGPVVAETTPLAPVGGYGAFSRKEGDPPSLREEVESLKAKVAHLEGLYEQSQGERRKLHSRCSEWRERYYEKEKLCRALQEQVALLKELSGRNVGIVGEGGLVIGKDIPLSEEQERRVMEVIDPLARAKKLKRQLEPARRKRKAGGREDYVLRAHSRRANDRQYALQVVMAVAHYRNLLFGDTVPPYDSPEFKDAVERAMAYVAGELEVPVAEVRVCMIDDAARNDHDHKIYLAPPWPPAQEGAEEEGEDGTTPHRKDA